MSLREERVDLANKAADITNKAYREARPLTKDERQKVDRIHADIDALKGRIDRDERQVPYVRPNKRFVNWLSDGSPEGFGHRDIMNFEISDRAPRSLNEARALTSIDIAGGAALAPVDTPFSTALEVALQSADGVREAGATEVRTPTGTDLPVPCLKDNTAKGRIVRENTAQTQTDPAFSLKRLGAYTYSSDEVQLPITLFQDSGYPVEELLGTVLGERIARAQSEHWIAGDGANQPQGVLGSATDSGVTTAAVSSVSYAELLALQHSVDPAYRAKGAWLLHDDTLKAVKLLVDTTGRPIWTPGISFGASDSILGRPFVASPYMPAIAAGVKSVLFGDFSRYFIRTVQGATLSVLRERYAEKGLLSFILFIRSDGGLADAGTHPIKFLTQHS